MNTTVIYPKHKVLKKYVQYFLFIDTFDEEKTVTFNCFPNTNCSLSINKGNIDIRENGNHHCYNNSRVHSFYIGIYKKPIQFIFHPNCEEVSINFEPSGLDLLINEQLSKFPYISEFLDTVFAKKLGGLKNISFSAKCIYKRAELMENYLLNIIEKKTYFKHVPLNEFSFYSVNEMASHFNMSYRSFHRYFKNTYLISPVQFLVIKRFRNTLKNIGTAKSARLTDIVFEQDYYDQSHMIKDFKKMTYLSPKEFINRASVINSALWWYPAN